ncbi:hypothetical protein B296_00030773 [Ensete ventricosum]|uniref:Reverse transcriptase domain-containing protein n=1 Tax=Ensete ventricosum TaxID=4639 RepID=A0A426ZSR5_ENSVE|nr:hypothetical protein B296_00030773 [Ensete ventricosum]
MDRDLPLDKGKGLLAPPNCIKTRPEERDRGRYYRFHREYGHDTEEYRDLKNQIKDLIHQGHLSHYVQRRMDHIDRQSERDRQARPIDPVERQIDVIVDGLAMGGDSTSARKAYARATVEKRPRRRPDPKISFQPEREEYPDHHDALAVTVCIANARVKRIMIDTQSATDILYFETFHKLGLTDQDLTLLTSMLTGFTGDSIAPLGMMTLSLKISEEPRTKTLMVFFMVVDLPSAYKAIIG